MKKNKRNIADKHESRLSYLKPAKVVRLPSCSNSRAFLNVLLYFDLFRYPLTGEEIFNYTGTPKVKIPEAKTLLAEMVKKGFIRHHEGFYYVSSDETLIQRRIEGSYRAKSKMKTAKRYSRIISWFPFVRGVFLSGSISKGFLSDNDDIDYFIITDPGRVWLTRSMLTLFKKIFLLNSFKNFCINYFIDSENLLIKEQNRFTATEIVFLFPMYNRTLYREFMEKNRWVRGYYPSLRQCESYSFNRASILKHLFELILDNSFGRWLDDYLMNSSLKFIRNKYSYMEYEYFNKCFLLEKQRIRYLPNCQQLSIMDRFKVNVQSFERKTGLRLRSG